MTLDNRRELFAREYIKHLCGSQAARDIGIKPASARSEACRMLAEPEVQERIAQLMAERAERVQVDADFVLRQLVEIAAADPNDLVEHRRTACRYCHSLTGDYQRTPAEMKRDREDYDRQVQAALKADSEAVITPFDERGGGGFNPTLDPDPECQNCFGQGIGDVFVKDTRDISRGARSLYAGVKTTKEGIEVRLHSKEKALELLGRHLGMWNDKLEVSAKVDVVKRILQARGRAGNS